MKPLGDCKIMGLGSLKNKNLWFTVFVVIQILFSVEVGYGYSTINSIIYNFKLPTPTCPEGYDNIHMPFQQRYECAQEVREIYIPKWLPAVTRISVFGILLCMLCSISMLFILHHIPHWSWRIFWFQLAMFLLFVCGSSLYFPGGPEGILSFIVGNVP